MPVGVVLWQCWQRHEMSGGDNGLEAAPSAVTEELFSVTHYTSAADVVIISALAIVVIAAASLISAIVAREFGAALAFGVVMDSFKIPVFVCFCIS
jgi:hypothetical protein